MTNPTTNARDNSLGEYGANVPVRASTRDVSRVDVLNPGVVTTALLNAIDRLEDTLHTESTLLRSGKGTSSLEDFNYRKSHGLLELTRASRNIDPDAMDEKLKIRLASLRGALETNARLLQTHLDAAREISGILADAMRQADSDGTYSAPAGPGASA